MIKDTFPYAEWVNEALHLVLKKALRKLSENGPIGDHHFYISFRTIHEGVKIPEFLLEEYPEEITIVLQHQFDELVVNDDDFEVCLVFNGRQTVLKVPFNAVTSFADPSVNFGLQMDSESERDLAIDPGSSSRQNKETTQTKNNGNNKIESQSLKTEKPGSETYRSQEEGESSSVNETNEVQESNDSKSANVIALDKFRKK